MPTGYTARIAEGITFEEFATDCMRAFGACAQLREEPLGTPPPDAFEVDNYHLDAIKTAVSELKKVLAMSSADAGKEADNEYNERKDRLVRQLNEMRALRLLYNSMLEKATAWVSPTPEHDDFKKFMIDQITTSIEYDCNESHCTRSLKELVKQTGEDLRISRAESIMKSVEYHQAIYQGELDQAKRSNGWVKAIRDTFK